MNTKALQKHYDTLTPKERVALLAAAVVRNDEQERAALLNTSPKRTYSVASHYFAATALDRLAAVHVAQVLNLGFVFLLAREALRMIETGESPDETRIDEIYQHMQDLAGVILSIDAAWRLFCQNNGQDPDLLLYDLPGCPTSPGAPARSDTFSLALEMARLLADDKPRDPQEIEELAESIQGAYTRLAD